MAVDRASTESDRRDSLMAKHATIDAPRLITRAEACEYLRCSPWALHQYLHRSRDANPLPARRVGRRDVFLVAEILAWTEREERNTERAKARRRQRRKRSTRVSARSARTK